MDSEKPAPASPSPGLDCVWKCPTPEWCGEHGCDVKAKNAQRAAAPSPGLDEVCESCGSPFSIYVIREAGFVSCCPERKMRPRAPAAAPSPGPRDAVIEECAQAAHTYAVDHGFSISEANMQRDALRALKSQEPT